jgi:hypothetical protein
MQAGKLLNDSFYGNILPGGITFFIGYTRFYIMGFQCAECCISAGKGITLCHWRRRLVGIDGGFAALALCRYWEAQHTFFGLMVNKQHLQISSLPGVSRFYQHSATCRYFGTSFAAFILSNRIHHLPSDSLRRKKIATNQ